jgi:hydroxymethylglutaryl-CoA reductase
MEEKSSRIKEFYLKNHSERLECIKEFARLSEKEINLLKNLNSLSFKAANRMIENVISVMPVPLGIATNFCINKKEYLVPMATEEPSIIAAASYAAKLSRTFGGFTATTTEPLMIGQIQILNVADKIESKKRILEHKQQLIEKANKQDPVLIEVGGGMKDITVRTIQTSRGTTFVVHIIVNVQDAMGANIINTMAEKITPDLETLTGGNVTLRIVSNLSAHRIVTATATWEKQRIGEQVIENILDAYALAQADPFRCATQNKGVMNGIDAVVVATGNDFRAVEAGAHAYASMEKGYKPLTHYHKDEQGNIVGTIKMPMAVGITGGITKSHPAAKITLKILNVQTACELAQVIASVGLSQNFAALKALVTEGIQRGHMKLHSKNIAISAGVENGNVDIISQQMVKENNISINRAQELLKQL